MVGVLQKTPTSCVQACVASIFEVPIESVPEFSPLDWGIELTEWLRDLGYGVINITPSATVPFPDGVPAGYTLGGINHNNGSNVIGHSVVCLDGYIVFDPLKGQVEGKQRPDQYTILYPLDVAREIDKWDTE